MGLLSNFMDNLGGKLLGTNLGMSSIAGDPRISTNQDETSRIKTGLEYYAGSYVAKAGMPENTVRYLNSQGTTKNRQFNCLNVTKTCAQRLASICLNSGFDLSIQYGDDSDTSDKLTDLVNSIFNHTGFKGNLESKLELATTVGGMAVRPYVDNGNIKFAWVRADQFYSLDSNTEEISQAAIASNVIKKLGNKTHYYTMLEFHQWVGQVYQISFELYKSDDIDILGGQVPLGTDGLYDDLAPMVQYAGLTRPMFAYFKCPGQNNIDPTSPMGVGFVANAQPVLDAINYAHDSFVWDMRMGRRKVMVPNTMLRPSVGKLGENSAGARPVLDPDQDVYMGINAGLDSNVGITQINPDIRVADYTATMQFFLNELENIVGLSTGTFSQNAQGGITTATQVVSENSMTYQTRQSYLNQITKFLSELVISVLEIGQYSDMFNGNPLVDEGIDLSQVTVNIHYDDGVFVDKDTQMKSDETAMVSGALSKKTFLERNYGMSDNQAQAELDQVASEAPEPVASPFDNMGQ